MILPFVFNQKISIHALRGEGDFISIMKKRRSGGISIHALRGEGDEVVGNIYDNKLISIHALRGEGDAKSTNRT